jgi:predicted Zn-ribbon and HTH transcriptional regulator
MSPIHREMITLLREKEMSAEGLSDALGISAEEVLEAMSSIVHSLDSHKERFVVRPSRCQSCGYVAKGQRWTVLPDRCRQCRAAPLKRPAYRVSSTDL